MKRILALVLVLIAARAAWATNMGSCNTIGGIARGTCSAMTEARNRHFTTPAAQSGTSSSTAVMNGWAGAVQPVATGNVFVIITSYGNNVTSSSDGCSVQLVYGTGTAPTNGASPVGTAIGQPVNFSSTTNVPLSLVGYVSGLTLDAPYWIDVQFNATTGGTCSLGTANIVAIEE